MIEGLKSELGEAKTTVASLTKFELPWQCTKEMVIICKRVGAIDNDLVEYA